VVASGGRRKAFDNFCDALSGHPNEVILLLIDSERPVQASVWAHLEAEPDDWEKPHGATDEQAHLMVQCMEAWFLADKEALSSYYAQGFRMDSLPRRQNVEEIPKEELVPAPQHASGRTTKGKYHKAHHGFAILALVDPARVRAVSAHAARFFEVLERESRR